MSLYQINEEILNCINQETGEIDNFELFEKLQMQRDDKIENIALWYKELLAKAAALKAEKESFAEREKSVKNNIERLKRYLYFSLAGQAFETTRCKIGYRKSEVVEIEENAKIPETYLTYKQPEPNKTEIKKAIKEGVEIPGVSLVERQNIQIK